MRIGAMGSRGGFGSLGVLGGASVPGWLSALPRLIVDTDFAGDCDDAIALAVLVKAYRDRLVYPMAVVASSSLDASGPGVSALIKTYGLSYTQIYAYQGATGTYLNYYAPQVRDRFGVASQSRTAYTDSTTGYRRMLASSPNGSVTIVAIGAHTALSLLLNSSADSISSLTGSQLVAAKVSKLVIMGGQFPTGGPEANVARDPTSAQNIATNWPTPMIWMGSEIGTTVFSGPYRYADALLDPVRYAYDLYKTGANGLTNQQRPDWDGLAVRYAIYGAGSDYGFGGQNGTVTVDVSGNTTWSATAGNSSYVTKVSSDTTLGAYASAAAAATEVGKKTLTDTSSFTFDLTEGSGEWFDDPSNSNMIGYLGQSGGVDSADPTWTDIGGGKWVLTFNGSSQFCAVPTRTSFNNTAVICAVIVNLAAVTGQQQLMCRDNGVTGNTVFQFRNNAGKLEFVSRNAAGAASTLTEGGTSVVINNWSLFLAYVNGTSVVLRKNGVQVASGTATLSLNTTSTGDNITLGARDLPTGTLLLNGKMACAAYKAGAVAGDVATIEAAMTAIATAKGITLS